MEIKINKSSDTIKVSGSVFDCPYNESIIHQAVVAYNAGGRKGSKSQKTRSEVSGGGKKPWKQKGGGRARAGTIRSPIWRTGGVTFAAKPRDYYQKINKKMYRSAIKSIISELYRQGRIVVIDEIDNKISKTKDFIEYTKNFSTNINALFIIRNISKTIELASRNISNVVLIDSSEINPIILLSFEKIIIDKITIRQINEWLL